MFKTHPIQRNVLFQIAEVITKSLLQLMPTVVVDVDTANNQISSLIIPGQPVLPDLLRIATVLAEDQQVVILAKDAQLDNFKTHRTLTYATLHVALVPTKSFPNLMRSAVVDACSVLNQISCQMLQEHNVLLDKRHNVIAHRDTP
jgi:hypothetical protein